MNIGEQFYCSRCMTELNEEGRCHKCGYDPREDTDPNALEEGTLLHGIRFQIGAVMEKTDKYYIYGAYDYLKQKPAYILEVYPDIGLKRIDDRIVTAIPELEKQFEEIKAKVISSITSYYERFENNNTIYLCMTTESGRKFVRLPLRQEDR